MSISKSNLFEVTDPLLDAMYREIQDLSKKKPDGTLNLGKIKIINRLLEDLKIILSDEPSIKYLDVLDEEVLPQYSDVVLIMSQYNSAMHAFKEKYYDYLKGWSIK